MYKCPSCKKTKFSVFVGIEGMSLDENKSLDPQSFDYSKSYIASIECDNCDYIISGEDTISDIFGSSCSICGSKTDVNDNGICYNCMSIYNKINKINNTSKKEDKVQSSKEGRKEKKTTIISNTASKKSTKNKNTLDSVYDEYFVDDDIYED